MSSNCFLSIKELFSSSKGKVHSDIQLLKLLGDNFVSAFDHIPIMLIEVYEGYSPFVLIAESIIYLWNVIPS